MSETGPIILDSSNIAENYPGVCLPLTCTFVEEVYRLIFARLAERMLGYSPEAMMPGVVCDMVRSFHGRLYYRLDNWYRLLQILPFRSRLIPMWQASLGVAASDLPTPPRIPLTIRAHVLRRFLATWRRTPDLMDQLERDYAAITDGIDVTGLDNQALLAVYERLKAGLLATWDVTLINDLQAFLYVGLAARLRSPISGADLASLEPLRALEEVKAQVAANPEVRAELSAVAHDDDARRWLDNGSDLAHQLNAYLHQYGDRGPGELKLETVTWRLRPRDFIAAVLGPPTSVPGDAAEPAGSRWVTKRALRAVAGRESSRLNRTRIFGHVRDIMRAIGHNLATEGRLDEPDDVFWLTLDEVLGVADPNQVPLQPTVAARKAEWESFADQPNYQRLSINAQGVVVGQGDDAATPLTGSPCSAGVVEAEAIVVHDPQVAGDVRGKILVATATDPGWVFLLSQASGVIAERGSMLSHVAIISRELGLPAVVGVSGATTALRTGDRLRMNGGTGAIEVVHRAI